MKVELFYDQECPFCREYSKFVMLRKKYDISIYNARENISVLINFRNQGYDINTGMIVQISGFKSIIYSTIRLFKNLVISLFGKT